MAQKKTTKKPTTKKKVVAKKTAPKKAPAKKAVVKKAVAKKTVAKKAPKVVSKPVDLPKTTIPLVNSLPKLSWTLPARTFAMWSALVVIIFAFIGTFLAHTLVDARKEDLITEIKERTAIQAASRAAVVSEWLNGRISLANNITNSDLMRLFSAEMTINSQNSKQGLRSALVAQQPYMQQTIREFVDRNSLISAYLIGKNGQAFLASRPMENFSIIQQSGVSNVFATGVPQVLPARMEGKNLVLDLVKPIFAMDSTTSQPKVTAVFMFTQPIADKLPDLLNVGPLARDGERANLVQKNIDEELTLVRTGSLSTLELTEANLLDLSANSTNPFASPIDGVATFASLYPVTGSPFRILHEFQAKKALSFIRLYRNGVYGMVTLAIMALVSASMMIIGYLVAQRNRTRVKHQGKTMQALVKAIEIRDPYLSGHHDRLARMAVALGNELNLPIPQRSTLYYAGQLCGIGKIFIPQEILTKKGKLTSAERKKMENHIGHTTKVLKDVDFDLPIADVIEQMHELMDGTGYPRKLEGGEINILSRVLTVADTYCAMTRPRAYRDAIPDKKVIKYFKENPSKYDEKVVKALIHYLQNS